MPDNSKYYIYKPKNQQGFFRNTSEILKKSGMYGDSESIQYPLTSSIYVNFYSSSNLLTEDRIDIYALQNALGTYLTDSPHYYYSSSFGDKFSQEITLISIPSIFFGSSIKKGSIKLTFNYSGSTVAVLEDRKYNGELIETFGPNSGSVAGVALYNHGFLLLTGSWDFNLPTSANWKNWGSSFSNYGSEHLYESASYDLNFDGVNYIPTLTMFARAEKQELNFSTNPTFIDYENNLNSYQYESSSSFYESSNLPIKNITKYKYENFSGSLEKTVFISKIGIYDDKKNLIAIAKLAKPVKKLENRDFIFKLKIDF